MNADAILRLADGAEAVVTGSGVVVLRNGGRTVEAKGLRPELLRAVVEAVDGIRTHAQVVAQLAQHYPRDHVEAVLRGLTGTVLADTSSATVAQDGAVGVLGNGPLASGLVKALQADGYPDCRQWPTNRFASCADPVFRTRQQATMPLLGPEQQPAGDKPLLSAVELDRLMRGVDLAVCALEWTPYRAHLDVVDAALRTGTPVLFVSGARHGGTVGPVYVPGAGNE